RTGRHGRAACELGPGAANRLSGLDGAGCFWVSGNERRARETLRSGAREGTGAACCVQVDARRFSTVARRRGPTMDWFERLTGFRETSYDETRRRLEVDGCRLRSRVNGKSYAIGELELLSVQTWRERVHAAGGLPGRIKVAVVPGDVRRLHQLPEYAGALFQVASQFNLLEMVSPEVTPEQGVTRYQHDKTQGPACAIAAGAATIYRNYFVPVRDRVGQTRERQLDGLAHLGAILGSALG